MPALSAESYANPLEMQASTSPRARPGGGN